MLIVLTGLLLACDLRPLATNGETSASIPSPSIAGPAIQTTAPQPPTTACTHCVAPGGSDSAPGTEAQPWLTFQHAADTAQPGDTICFRGGTYPTDEVHLARSGRADVPIAFIAYPGERPILDGEDSAVELLALDPGTSYLCISGFTLRNFRIWGMELSGGNRHIHLDHLDIGGCEAGIRFTVGDSGEDPSYGPVSDVVLEDSTIHDCIYTAVDCTPGPCDRTTFRRLEIYGSGWLWCINRHGFEQDKGV